MLHTRNVFAELCKQQPAVRQEKRCISWDTFDSEHGEGDPGIRDSPMPLVTGQTNTVPPKRCNTPCLAQGRPKLHNIGMTVRRRSADGKRYRTVMQKALKSRSPPTAFPPSKVSQEVLRRNFHPLNKLESRRRTDGHGSSKKDGTHGTACSPCLFRAKTSHDKLQRKFSWAVSRVGV